MTIDITAAQLPPFRAFHNFHEDINVHIKVANAASVLLVRHAADPSAQGHLGELIAAAHPSWNAPPVKEMSIDIQRSLSSSTSSFVILAAFSAFDDFLVATEAEVSRNANAGSANKRACTNIRESPPRVGSRDEDEREDRVYRLYGTMGWSTNGCLPLAPILRYFRMCRNCIAHRSSRASRALAEHSHSKDLIDALKVLQGNSARSLVKFDVNDKIHITATLAIMCSHVLRLIAFDANVRLVESLGVAGVMRTMAYHAIGLNSELGGPPPSRPEAFLNILLVNSRIRIGDRIDTIRAMKSFGLWDDYVRAIT